MNPLRFVLKLKSQLKPSGGFTLVELMVAMVISSIVLATLLTFMNTILSSERREQAKTTTDQEIQTALDYIVDDLQEAAYIYDADGIAAIKSQLPNPTATNQVPVLVFWKRAFLPKDRQIVDKSGISTRVGCLARSSDNKTCDERDYFVYSLVTYYLIKDGDPTWSPTARIGRLELQDGIRDPNNSNNYLTNPAPGFRLFDLTLSGTLKDKMNAWNKDISTNYDLKKNKIETLLDYIDQSTGDQAPVPSSCANISPNAQLVPAKDNTTNPLKLSSFYACVDSSQNIAQVYLRGNALARISRDATYSNSQSAYFPSADVQIKSRGMFIDK